MKAVKTPQVSGSNINIVQEMLLLAFFITSLFIKFIAFQYGMSKSFFISKQLLALLSSFSIITIFFVTVSLCHRKARLYVAIILDVLLTILILTDILHLRYYSDLFTFNNIGLINQIGEISESVFALIRCSDLLYFLDIPLIILFIFLNKKSERKTELNSITLKRLIASLFLIFLSFYFVSLHIRTYNKKVPGALNSMWDRVAVCSNVGAPTYHVADLLNVLRENLFKERLSEHEREEIVSWFESNKNSSNIKEHPLFGIAKNKNLIIIQAESLQQFVINLKVNGVPVTPNLNDFLKESVYFSRTYDQTGLGNSSDAEFLSNIGLYPSSSGVAFTRFASNRYNALPKVLEDNGYFPIALHGDRPSFWNRERMYSSIGFRKYISKRDFDLDEIIGMGLSDRSFFAQTASILENTPKPFYAFLVTLSSHYPFNYPPLIAQSKLDVGEFGNTLVGNYLKSMNYLDEQFGMFLDELKKKGLLKSSVIVIYGDHTAVPKWDAANLEKLLGKDLKSAHSWRDLLKVPLIIRTPDPNSVKFMNSERAVGLIDLPKSVALLLEVEYHYGFGKNIFEDNKEPVVFRNGSYIYDFAYIEPSFKKAVDLRNGQILEYSRFREISKEAAKELAYNDKILAHDLIPSIYERTKEE